MPWDASPMVFDIFLSFPIFFDAASTFPLIEGVAVVIKTQIIGGSIMIKIRKVKKMYGYLYELTLFNKFTIWKVNYEIRV